MTDDARSVSIETRGVNVRLEGPDATPATAYALWSLVMENQELHRTEVAGSVTGFVTEQSDEGMHDRLPGGWIA